MLEVQTQVSWPPATTVGVNVTVPVALGTVEVMLITPVPSVMAIAETYLVAPGNE